MLRWFDGFETSSSLSQRYEQVSGSTVVTDTVRSGSRAARHGNNTGYYFQKTLDDQSTWIVGFAIRSNSTPSTQSDGILNFLDSGNTEQLSLEVVNGVLTLYRGGTIIASGTRVLAASVWYYIETKLTIANSGGTCEVRLNGATEISFTGDTQNSASLSTARHIRFNRGFASGATNSSYFDDIYICDGQGTKNNNFLGDVKVVALVPSGAGSSAQFTPSAGSNYENIDDITSDGDTTYNSSSTAGQKDLFVVTDLPSDTAEVHGVAHVMELRKDDAGSRTARSLVKSGVTESAGAIVPVFDSYTVETRVMENDPGTSGDWTVSAVNALELGYELVS